MMVAVVTTALHCYELNCSAENLVIVLSLYIIIFFHCAFHVSLDYVQSWKTSVITMINLRVS